MSGYHTVRRIKWIEEELAKLGFQMAAPSGYDESQVAVIPLAGEDSPVYAKDAEIFHGSLEDLFMWLCGWLRARDYDTMIFGAKHSDKRKEREERIVQDRKNKQLMNMLKAKEQA